MTPAQFAQKYFGQGGQQSAVPFRTDLQVVAVEPAPGVAPTNSINPQYCATNQAAADLLSLLSGQYPGAKIVQGAPLENFSQSNNLYFQTDTVPYISITGTNLMGQQVNVLENAGELIEAFGHGYPAETAMGQMLNWISLDLASQTAN